MNTEQVQVVVRQLENLIQLEFNSNQSVVTERFLTKIFSSIEKEFSRILNLRDAIATHELSNKFMMVQSLLRPVIFLTNWFGHTMTRDRLSRDFVNIYVLAIKVDYKTYYKSFKDFYQLSLQFEPSSYGYKDWKKAQSDFFQYLPYSIRVIMRNKFFDATRGCKRAAEFCNSINFLKRGCGVLLPYQVEESVAKSIKTLSKETIRTDFKTEVFVRMVTRLICKPDSDFSLRRIDQIVPPSKSATLETTRLQGGGYSILNNYREGNDGMPECGHLYNKFLQENEVEDNRARISLLMEANKCRFLTIQSTKLQCSALALQHYLSKSWKDSKFSCAHEDWLGRFMRSEEYLIDIDDFKYDGSFDYSAATDGCSQYLSHIIINELIKILRISSEDAEILYKVIAPRLLDTSSIAFGNHPNKDEAKLIVENLRDRFNDNLILQTNGQLMGGPLSFPMLCIENVSLFFETLYSDVFDDIINRKGYKYKLKRYHTDIDSLVSQMLFIYHNSEVHWDTYLIRRQLEFLLVNGDDAYIPLKSIDQFEALKRVSKNKYGLEINEKSLVCELGKCKQINSVMVYRDERIHYFNQSIYLNNNIKNIGSLTKENLADCAKAFYYNDVLLTNFYQKWVDTLFSAKERKFCWLPKEFGGYNLHDLQPEKLSRKELFEILQQPKKIEDINPKRLPPQKDPKIPTLESEMLGFFAKKLLSKASRMGICYIDTLFNLLNKVDYKYEVAKKDVASQVMSRLIHFSEYLDQIRQGLYGVFKFTFIDRPRAQTVLDYMVTLGIIDNEPHFIQLHQPDFQTDLSLFSQELYIYPVNLQEFSKLFS